MMMTKFVCGFFVNQGKCLLKCQIHESFGCQDKCSDDKSEILRAEIIMGSLN